MALVSRAPAFLAFCTLLLRAQTPPQEVAIRTHAYTPPSLILHAETNLVEADVTVRDAIGHAVGGLMAHDFEIVDNGVPQTIAAFSEVRRDAKPDSMPFAPKFVTFFFDDLHMGMPGPGRRFALPFVKQAARDFAAKYLKTGDRMAIATASGEGELDFTDDARLFTEKTDRLKQLSRFISSFAEYHQDNVNTLAALSSAAKRLAEMPGTRILVFMSAGFIIHLAPEFDSQPELDRFIEAAVHANIAVPVIDAKGLSDTPGKSSPERRPLQEIGAGTGGHLFENSNDLAGSMELAAHPEITYLLAFNPGIRDGKFHTLKIHFTSRRDDSLEFRPGYLSRQDDASGKKLTARAPMDDAVFSGRDLQDVSAVVQLNGGQPKDGITPVSVGIAVDVNRLQFASSHGRHLQQIVFLIALLDAKGNFVTGKESIMDLALTGAKLDALKKDGLKTVSTLDATPGIYRVRTVVREGMKGGLSASTTPIEIREN